MAIQPVAWNVQREHMLIAIQWACKKVYNSIDRLGMNRRSPTERLDDKIMGDIATIAILEYLHDLGIPALAYDYIRADQFKDPDPGWDVAIGADETEWKQFFKSPKNPAGLITASVRSSRLPRNDTLNDAIRLRDFKIFTRPGKRIDECITTDIEMQVYYNYGISQLGNRKIEDKHIVDCIKDYRRGEEIIRRLDVDQRFGQCFLTAWNYKTAIVEHSSTLREPTWGSTHQGYTKRMWHAPLRLGKSMKDLIELNKEVEEVRNFMPF